MIEPEKAKMAMDSAAHDVVGCIRAVLTMADAQGVAFPGIEDLRTLMARYEAAVDEFYRSIQTLRAG